MNTWGFMGIHFNSFGAAYLFARFLLWFDRYEKEPFWLVLGVFLWGRAHCRRRGLPGQYNFRPRVYLFTGSEKRHRADQFNPFCAGRGRNSQRPGCPADILPGRSHFDSILDGIVIRRRWPRWALLPPENAYYIYTTGFLEKGWSGFWDLALIASELVGWQPSLLYSLLRHRPGDRPG